MMKVGIGIVTKNRAGILPKAIESALSQSYENKQVFVLDDGSEDETHELKERFPEVVWMRNEESQGLMEGRNRLMSVPGVDLFCSLDDDAWFLENDEIEIAVGIMQRLPEVGAVAFEILEPQCRAHGLRGAVIPARSFVGCGHLLRLDAVKRAGFYEASPGLYGGEENDLSIRLIELGYKIAQLPGHCVWHDKTMTSRNVSWQHRSGVCNDLVFAVRRCPVPQLLWVLPGKIVNHLWFVIRFALTSKSRGDDFSQSVLSEIGRWGFLPPFAHGLRDFFTCAPQMWKERDSVSVQSWKIYAGRGARKPIARASLEPPTIGISITTRNRAKPLAATLRVLKELDPLPHEVVVCLDGCSDDSRERAEEAIASSKLSVTFIENPSWAGSIPSRNRIIDTLKSDIILSLDDDSYPIEKNFLAQLQRLFVSIPQVAVITFPQVTDEFPETLTQIRPQKGSRSYTGTFNNSGSAIRRDFYKSVSGYPNVFQHAYEEPDFALQCIAAGYTVLFEPALRIRHHYSREARNEMRTHQFHARNEVWSALIRCPFVLLPLVILYRGGRQFAYSWNRGWSWVRAEPNWWRDAIRGFPACLAQRKVVGFKPYWRWMNLIREPEPVTFQNPQSKE